MTMSFAGTARFEAELSTVSPYLRPVRVLLQFANKRLCEAVSDKCLWKLLSVTGDAQSSCLATSESQF